MPFTSAEPRIRDTHPEDVDYCQACGKMIKPGRGCWIHIHGGGDVIVRDGADLHALGGDPADLGFWRLGLTCQRKVPAAFRYSGLG